ncbi:MAG: DUF3833 family protein, partial [Geminicoccaceae bacterium]
MALAIAALVTGCSAMDLSDFAERQPVLLSERYFAANLQGWGLEFGPMGGIGRRIQLTASGRFDESTQTLHLDEIYRFDDGHVDRLQWRIRKVPDSRYEADEALSLEPGQGVAAGSAFRMIYRRAVPQADGSSTTLSFDDWFVRIDEDTVMVHASIQKLMVPIGSLTVLYRRLPS